MGWVLHVSDAYAELRFVRDADESSIETRHPEPALHVPVGGHLKLQNLHSQMAKLAARSMSRPQDRRLGQS